MESESENSEKSGSLVHGSEGSKEDGEDVYDDFVSTNSPLILFFLH